MKRETKRYCFNIPVDLHKSLDEIIDYMEVNCPGFYISKAMLIQESIRYYMEYLLSKEKERAIEKILCDLERKKK